ncbi:glycosyl hydrolase [Massilioclostridium coli]|uniref:glycosyl hydrolase n=1 Tax=Massilioclostridium coli TaxID=1870991 RepID=UPI0022E180D1|nr:glycosyl hydrolase [Massilioclostridium coli]
MKMKKRLILKKLLALTTALTISTSMLINPVQASEENLPEFIRGFINISNEVKPQIRYWWQNGLVDEKEIRSQIQSIANAGFGGAEIICKGSSFDGEDGTSWGSDNWLASMEIALDEAKHLGLHLTFTISSGWPAVTPAIQSCDDPLAIKQIGYGKTEAIASGQQYNGAIPAPEVQTNTDSLLAVVAVQLDESVQTAETQYIKEDSFTVLTSQVNQQDNTIQWTAPDQGNWIILSFYMQSASDEEYPPIDHFSKEATKALTDYWDTRMITWGDEKNQIVDGIFEDSLELSPDYLWTPKLLEEFKDRRGYDLTPYLPLIFVPGLHFDTNNRPSTDDPAVFDTQSTMGERVRMDYYQTLTDLYTENHIESLQQWCESHGWDYRGQVAYGAPMEMTQSAAQAGIAETESLYFAKLPGNGSPKLMDSGTRDGYRMQTGMVNLTGKEVYSSELSPLRSGAYEQSTSDLLNMINSNMAAGVNLSVVHGYSNNGVYQGKYEGNWGGYDGMSGFFSNSWDKTPDFTQFADSMGYVARNQYVLRQGHQDVDIAYYRFEYFEVQVIEDMVTPDLEENGYSYDFVSPYLLNLDTANAKDGVIAPEGPSYKALVVDNEDYMPLDTAKKMLSYLDQGVKLFFIGKTPSMTPSYGDSMEDSQLIAVMEQIKNHANTTLLDTETQLVSALKGAGIMPDTQYQSANELSSYHNVDGNNDYYYLYNPSSQPITQTITFDAEGTPYELNAWDGSIQPVSINSWTLSVESWHPGDDPSNNAIIAKTMLEPVSMETLIPWRDIQGMENVSGIGRYSTTVTMETVADHVVFDLGKVANSSFRIAVNGMDLPPANQFDTKVDLAPYLRQGENTITVTTASTLINAALVNGLISPIWQFTGDAEPVPQDYGMLGNQGKVQLNDLEEIVLVEQTGETNYGDQNKPQELIPQTGDSTLSFLFVIGTVTALGLILGLKRKKY